MNQNLNRRHRHADLEHFKSSTLLSRTTHSSLQYTNHHSSFCPQIQPTKSKKPKQSNFAKRGLNVITVKFIEIIKSSEDQSVNLNDIASLLGIQKRRVYDVVNTLEGTGKLVKISKNVVQWVQHHQIQPEQLQQLRLQLQRLSSYQNKLDEMTDLLSRKLSSLNQPTDLKSKYCLLTPEESCNSSNPLEEQGHFREKIQYRSEYDFQCLGDTSELMFSNMRCQADPAGLFFWDDAIPGFRLEGYIDV